MTHIQRLNPEWMYVETETPLIIPCKGTNKTVQQSEIISTTDCTCPELETILFPAEVKRKKNNQFVAPPTAKDDTVLDQHTKNISQELNALQEELLTHSLLTPGIKLQPGRPQEA